MSYKIKTNFFEGPLDLLLTLIENQKLDISRFSISKVTDEYLAAVAELNQTSDEIADFLVLASKLLYLKSKALLPQLPQEDEEEIEDIEKQLKEYKRYKEASQELMNILKKGHKIFEPKLQKTKDDYFLPPDNISLDNLFDILREILSRMPSRGPKEKKLEPKISLEEKLELLTKIIQKQKKVSFKRIIEQSNSKVEVIVTFLAVLEMVKKKIVTVTQKTNFGDLILKKL